jgi:hypothetical protein
MNADHSNICKFESEEGEDFRPVWQEIQALAEAAVKNVEQLRELESARTGQHNVQAVAQSVASE